LDAYRELSCQVRALSCGKRLTARIFGNIQVHVRNKQCLSLPLRIFAPWRLCVNCSLLQAGISHAKAQSRKEKPQSTTLPKNQHIETRSVDDGCKLSEVTGILKPNPASKLLFRIECPFSHSEIAVQS